MSDPSSGGRVILHVDMDAFFVSVELLDHPELRGRPVVVGGAGDRGVVAAASYEARAYGIHSAMPSARARRLCPHAVVLPGRYERYVEVSRRLGAIFVEHTPLVEPIALDEAFLDVTGVARAKGDGPTLAASIRQRIAEQEGLTCSVGVAPTKLVAKLASEAAKPRPGRRGPEAGPGVVVVTATELLGFLWAHPVEALWGVGPATRARLERLGVASVGDLARLPVVSVTTALGEANGRQLHSLANGIDDRAVVPDRRPKSVGHEETYPRDLRDRETLARELLRLSEAVGTRLRRAGLAGRTITIKVRFADFRTITRSVSIAGPTDATAVIVERGRALLDGIDPSPGVRLLGVSVANLATGVAEQLSLDDLLGSSGTGDRWGDRAGGRAGGAVGMGGTAGVVDAADRVRAEAAVDAVRDRFGDDLIGLASLLGRGDAGGYRMKRQGDAAWGPDSAESDGHAL